MGKRFGDVIAVDGVDLGIMAEIDVIGPMVLTVSLILMWLRRSSCFAVGAADGLVRGLSRPRRADRCRPNSDDGGTAS